MTPGTASLAELFADTPEELRRQALSHSSWVEARTESYGRLAFLGDSVLGLSVATLLFDEHPAADIGELTKILNQAVSGRACAEVARKLGLPEMLAERAPREGEGLPVETLLASERTLASVCERSSEAVVEAFDEEVEQATRERLDFKSELQERLARDGEMVNYEVANEVGPPHDRRFEVRATVGGDELGVGSGRSKKEAEQAAAQRALETLHA